MNLIIEGFKITEQITIQDSQNITIDGSDEDDDYDILLQDLVNGLAVNGGRGNDKIRISGKVRKRQNKDDDGDKDSPGKGSIHEGMPIIVRGGSGDDHLIIDFSRGNPISQAGLI